VHGQLDPCLGKYHELFFARIKLFTNFGQCSFAVAAARHEMRLHVNTFNFRDEMCVISVSLPQRKRLFVNDFLKPNTEYVALDSINR
jgi:hypothetical protein